MHKLSTPPPPSPPTPPHPLNMTPIFVVFHFGQAPRPLPEEGKQENIYIFRSGIRGRNAMSTQMLGSVSTRSRNGAPFSKGMRGP